MAQIKLTWLLISIVLISMFSAIFGVYWASMGSAFAMPSDAGNLSAYNKLDEINDDLEAVRDRATSIKEEQGVLDRLGNFFSNGFSMLMMIPKSFEMMFSFLNQAVLEIPMGDAGTYIAISLQTILLIIIFVGIILAVLLKVNT